MKRIAIVQSNYVPWKGYFDLIAAVDEFILYDDVQYTRHDWRNRNQIKTPDGPRWLTVPVKVKGKYKQTIRQTEINGTGWAKKHWKALMANYGRARYFEEIARVIEPLYVTQHVYLCDLNRVFIETICRHIGIPTAITSSSDYSLSGGKNERLVNMCLQANATEYVSGPAARAYIDEQVFADHGLALTWFEYSGYPEYLQLWGAFVHEVTILDLLFNCGGKDACLFMKHVRGQTAPGQ